jgi:hypothetical protein
MPQDPDVHQDRAWLYSAVIAAGIAIPVEGTLVWSNE